MRYVRARKGKLHWQRDMPSALYKQGLSKKTFTHPLGLAEGSTGSALDKAVAQASSAFELAVKTAQNSDPDLYDAAEIDQLATSILRKANLRPAQAHKASLSESMDSADELLWSGYVASQVDERDATVKQKAQALAYRKLVEKKAQPTLTLDDVWCEYLAERGVDITTREGKRQQQWWTKLEPYIGQHSIRSGNALEAIHSGLDQYVAHRREQGIKGQSIMREISQPVAAMRRASRQHRLGWVIEPPIVKPTSREGKPVLSRAEQMRLVEADETDKPHLKAICLLLLQGGMMASEINNLDLGRDVHLREQVPHLVVRKGKTSSRPRVIPIVVMADFIDEQLPEALVWLQGQTDSGWSIHLKRYLRRATGNSKVTAHGAGRHTLRANSAHAGANPMLVALIAGWSSRLSGVSDVMMTYGAADAASSESLKALKKESEKIHSHLITL